MKRTDEIHELMDSRKTGLLKDNDNNWSKITGDTTPGYLIQIIWKELGPNYPDKGYLFSLPGTAPDEGDIFVHVPNPQNPNGKDSAPEVFVHLSQLVHNDLVDHIDCFKPKLI